MSSIHTPDIPDPTWPDTWPRTAEEIHIFDRQGDVLLKLVRHIEEVEEESRSSSVCGEDRPQVEEVFESEPSASVEGPAAVRTPDEEPAVPEADENAQPDDASIHSDDTASSVDALTDVHMRVSSKHLILASPTFRSMLGPNFEEGQRLLLEGSTDIALGDDDPDAFEILLNIIHGLTRKVPRTVSLEMLTKIAILVNYYQMQEVVELFSDTWIEHLVKEGLPPSHGPEAIGWLLIAWVFHKPSEFRAVSRIIELGCDEKLEDDFDESLPIPAPVIAIMLSHRTTAISSALLILHNLIALYSTRNILCPTVFDANNSLACDSLLLGSLIKGCASIGLWPPTALCPPYHGIVFRDLAMRIRELKVMDVCSQAMGRWKAEEDKHGVKVGIEASLSALEVSMGGLNLEDFAPVLV